APTLLYTLSLHDALPIYITSTVTSRSHSPALAASWRWSIIAVTTSSTRRSSRPLTSASIVHRSGTTLVAVPPRIVPTLAVVSARSEEHTSELQSQSNLVC